MRGLVESHEQPPTIENLIDSWLKTGGQSEAHTCCSEKERTRFVHKILMSTFICGMPIWMVSKAGTRDHIGNPCYLAVRNWAKSRL